jgi:hypothetical protein
MCFCEWRNVKAGRPTHERMGMNDGYEQWVMSTKRVNVSKNNGGCRLYSVTKMRAPSSGHNLNLKVCQTVKTYFKQLLFSTFVAWGVCNPRKIICLFFTPQSTLLFILESFFFMFKFNYWVNATTASVFIISLKTICHKYSYLLLSCQQMCW